jgi:hypothetical protein
MRNTLAEAARGSLCAAGRLQDLCKGLPAACESLLPYSLRVRQALPVSLPGYGNESGLLNSNNPVREAPHSASTRFQPAACCARRQTARQCRTHHDLAI